MIPVARTAVLMAQHFVQDVIRSRKTFYLGLLTALVLALMVFSFVAMQSRGNAPGYGELMYSGCFGFLLPFAALFYAIAAISDEFDTGAAVYLFSRPLHRSGIFLGRWASAIFTVTILVTIINITAWLLARDVSLLVFLRAELAILLGSAAYVSLFAVISTMTRRPLAIGLLVIFFWESVIGQLPFAIHVLSIKYHAVSLAGSGLPLGAKTAIPMAQGMFRDLFGEAPLHAVVVLASVAAGLTAVASFRFVRTQAHRGD